ncbi:MAG: TonB-dependent receptor, partial [Pseudomonadota bacterium]
MSSLRFASGAGLAAVIACHTGSALAQGDSESVSNALMEEVTVTATKKPQAESVQEVPLAVNAFGADQLDALQVRDLASLSFKMPNVQLDDIGTTKGVANFTMRGLGVNSSIPSIDPAVGVFVDGVYLGINAGVIFDTFDLDSVEALRGPQGVLFGRNVTGGAVLMNTGDPTDELTVKTKATVDSGLRSTGTNYILQGVISGPIVKDRLSAKIGLYYNDDGGWFTNLADGSDFGESETTIVRGALKFTPTDFVEIIAKYENGSSDNQGPAAQSHTNGLGLDGQIVNFDRDSFDFAIDEPGFSNADWDQFSAEINIDVPFGDGRITNIFGFRQFEQGARSDIDASPEWFFHANILVDQDQFSNELRYSGRFADGRLGVTTGIYFFTQELQYSEQRDLLGVLTGGVAPAVTQDGGGIQDHDTFGVFAQAEYDLTDRLTFNAGVRYTEETKDV